MSFFAGCTGEAKDAFTQDLVPIPNGTHALSTVEGVKRNSGERPNIEFTWRVAAGEFQGRIVWQRLYVYDNDEKRARKARNMLLLLLKMYNLSVPPDEPTDMALNAFNGKMAMLTIGMYAMPKEDGTIAKGNYVMAVQSADDAIKESAAFESDVPF